MPYSQQDILTQNINTYPNNNSGQITPDSVKTFNQNWIQSVVFTDQTSSLVVTSASYAQNADTAATAIATPNAFVSASVNLQTITLTKGNGQATNLLISVSGSVASASYASVAESASFASTASFVLGGIATSSYVANAMLTASAAANIITFTKFDGSTFNVTVVQSGSVASASYAANADLLDGLNSTAFTLTSSFQAYTASMNLFSASMKASSGSYVTTSSFNAFTASSATSASNALVTASVSSNVVTFTKGNGTTFNLTVGSVVDTGSLATTSSLNAYTGSTNAFTASMKTFTGSIQTQVNALQAATSSYVTNAQTASMSVLSASYATIAGGLVNGTNITASNITVLNNLTVNGTASFAYTKTTTGSAVIIGDEFIILNADTPTAPFAGIQVYDTGSNATASFEWNGNGDYWIAVEETGQSAGILTGPLALAKGSETFPSTNKLTKGTGTTSIVDSKITDTGALVSIDSNTEVTGSLGVSGTITGTLSGTASFANNATSASYANNAQQATSASFATTASYFGGSVVSASYAATASSADTFTVGTALTASGLNYPTADGLEGQVLKTDGTNDLAFGDVGTIYENVYTGENITKGDPLYISGSQGANPIVYKADAGNAAKMPVTYVASETIAAGNTTRGIVLGLIEGIDLTGYTEGTEIFVAVGGGWTSTRPTGTAIIQVLGVVTKGGAGGKGLVLNPGPANLPNLASGNVWIGNANSIPTATSTGSINAATAVSASFANNAGAAQTAISSSFATNAGTAISASFASTAAASQIATSASYASNAQTAFSATSASYASNAQTAFSATSASFATTASFALTTAGGLQGSEIYSYTFLLMGA